MWAVPASGAVETSDLHSALWVMPLLGQANQWDRAHKEPVLQMETPDRKLWLWFCVLNGMSLKKKDISFTFIYLGVCVGGGHGVTCHGIHVEIVLPCGSWGSNSVHQTWWQALFPELHCWPGMSSSLWWLSCFGWCSVYHPLSTATKEAINHTWPFEKLPAFWGSLIFLLSLSHHGGHHSHLPTHGHRDSVL